MERKTEAILNNDQSLCNSIDQALEQKGTESVNAIISLSDASSISLKIL